jgi:hypothetical protein
MGCQHKILMYISGIGVCMPYVQRKIPATQMTVYGPLWLFYVIMYVQSLAGTEEEKNRELKEII